MPVNAVRQGTLEAVWWWANEADRLSCNATCHTACTLSADNSEAVGLNITHGKLHILTITDREQCREQQVTLLTARCVLALSNRTRHKQHARHAQHRKSGCCRAQQMLLLLLHCVVPVPSPVRQEQHCLACSAVQSNRPDIFTFLTTNDRGCCRPRQGTVLLLHCVLTVSNQIRQERHCQLTTVRQNVAEHSKCHCCCGTVSSRLAHCEVAVLSLIRKEQNCLACSSVKSTRPDISSSFNFSA